MRIDTEIRPVIVEIDGKEYNVAPKTVELLEKLRGVEDAAVKAGKMRHEMEMEQLELLLGWQAVRELFSAGKKENVDRVTRFTTAYWIPRRFQPRAQKRTPWPMNSAPSRKR